MKPSNQFPIIIFIVLLLLSSPFSITSCKKKSKDPIPGTEINPNPPKEEPEGTTTPPTALPNDEYTGAITLPVNADQECKNEISGTTLGATRSQAPGCSNDRIDDDVWYKFTATAASHFIKISEVKAEQGPNAYRNIQVLESAANAPGASILCAAMTMEEKFLTGLKVGATYFIRISSWSENVRINFKLCVSTPSSAPANDEYTGAVTLPVNANLECKNEISGTTLGATRSQTPGCSNDRIDDDVWYKFTATAASHFIKISEVKAEHGPNAYRNIQVLESTANAAPGTSILCAAMTMEEKFLTGLKVGATYFIRISSWSENVRINFKLCISTPPSAPANDEYTGAITLPVNANLECKNVISGTTLGATRSQTPGCSNDRTDDDVWFKFTATAASHLIKISEVKAAHGPNAYRNIQVLESAADAPGTSILCAAMTMEEKLLTGLKVGTTYFVRVSSWSENVRINFKICVTSPSD